MQCGTVRNENAHLFQGSTPFAGSLRLVRSQEIRHFQILGPICEWVDRQTYLIIERVSYRDKRGALLLYNNPPVHQVASPGLHAFLDGIDAVARQAADLEYLIRDAFVYFKEKCGQR